jgi:hypothetical protein
MKRQVTLENLVDDFISKKWPEIKLNNKAWACKAWAWHGFGVCWLLDNANLIRVVDYNYGSKYLDPAIPEFFDELSIFINSRMKRIRQLTMICQGRE